MELESVPPKLVWVLLERASVTLGLLVLVPLELTGVEAT
jgi:hypothetical protein